MAHYALPALLAGVVFVCFLPVLGNDFVNWDDLHSFITNPHYRGLSPTHLAWMFTTLYMGHYQPLSWLTHAIVYTIWGMNPFGYHLVNLLLHAANAIVFYFVIVGFLQQPWPAHRRSNPTAGHGAALVGALLFAIHPLRVEVVAWATERREVLCGFFLLLALLAYLRMQGATRTGRTWWQWYLGSIGCFALSLLSKASGMTFPIVLLALDFYPLGRLKRDAEPGMRAAVLFEKIPYALLSCGAAAIALVAVKAEAMIPLAGHGPIQRVMQAAYGLCFYLWKTALPWGLSPLYLLEKPLDPTEPRYLLSALAVAGISAGTILLRRRYPWALTAWTCYVVLVSPVLGFAQSGPQIAADRYTYLSCLPWAVVAAAGIQRWWHLWESRRPRWASASGLAALAAVLAVLGAGTYEQTRVWANSVTLWNHALQIDPRNYIAYNNRGNAWKARGNLDAALADFDQALRLNDKYAIAYYNRGNTRKAKGNIEGAIADLSAAIRLSPRYARTYNDRGNARKARGDLNGALADFNQALRLNPEYTDAYANRGSVRQAKGDLQGAIADFNAALRLNPRSVETYYNRANARKVQGDLAGAIADYSEALRLNPRFASAFNNRGNARTSRGDLDGALADFDQALRLNPRYANAYNNRGTVRRKKGDLSGARDDFRHALRFAPARGPYRATFRRNLITVQQLLMQRRRNQ